MQPYIVQTFQIYKGDVAETPCDSEESMADCLSGFYAQGYRLAQMSTVGTAHFFTVTVVMEYKGTEPVEGTTFFHLVMSRLRSRR